MQNQPKVIDKKVKTYIIFDRYIKLKWKCLNLWENIVFKSAIPESVVILCASVHFLIWGRIKAVWIGVLQSLPVSGFQIRLHGKVVKSGIAACDFDVMLDKDHETMIMIWRNILPVIMRILQESLRFIYMNMVLQTTCMCMIQNLYICCHHHHEHGN